MKRFVLSILLVCSAYLVAGALYLTYDFFRIQGERDELFTIQPGQKCVFIGASHVGCSITDEPKRHKKIWLHSTRTDYSRLCVEELARRGELKKLDVCAVQMTISFLYEPNPWRSAETWAKHWPLGFDYPSLRSCGLGPFAWSLLKKVYAWEKWELQSQVGNNRPPFINRPLSYQNERMAFYEKSYIQEQANYCADSVLNDLLAMRECCSQAGVRLIVFVSPIYHPFSSKFPAELTTQWSNFLNDLQKYKIEIFNQMDEFADESFSDPVHLTYSAATEFTRRFYDSIH